MGKEKQINVMQDANWIVNLFPIEWEYKALEEVTNWFKKAWSFDVDFYNKLIAQNKQIAINFKKNKIGRRDFVFSSSDKELVALVNKTANGFFLYEPVLARVLIYNSTLPQDIHIRKALLDNFLCKSAITIPKEVLKLDFLKGSELAVNTLINGESLSGIPCRSLVVGKLIDYQLATFEHTRLIDFVKESGAEESIEELRAKRIYDTNEGMVFDYAPLLRKILSKNGVIFEVFKEEDFEKPDWEELRYLADDVLLYAAHKAQGDPRQEEYAGDNLETAKYKFIVRYKNNTKEEIPFQLIPKWKSHLLKQSGKMNLTNIRKSQEVGGINKEDELQIAMMGLAKCIRKFDETKPATPQIFGGIKNSLSKAFEELSTEKLKKERREQEIYEYKTDRFFNKKILLESMESKGGNLDEPINEDGETLKESLPAEDRLSIFDEALLDEIKEKYPEIETILEKQGKGIPLTDNERQTYKRIIEKLKKQ